MTGNLNNLLDVGAAREGDVGPVSAGDGENEPRVSRLATTAFWIGCIPAILWALALAWVVAGFWTRPREHFQLGLGWMTLYAMLPAVVTLPVSLILGTLAICRIRRSQGATYGVSRAVFGMCAALVPLLGLPVAAVAGPTGTVVLGLAVVYWGWRRWQA